MMDQGTPVQLAEQVQQAYVDRAPLYIQGANSKAFYGRHSTGTPLSTLQHSGIISHEPSELVLRARAGTPLREIEQALAEQNKMLAFEPPYFSGHSTLGGCVAAGLSGPRRPFTGSVRDFVLGVGIINGQGQSLRFGGQVMKNVAGYDLSRFITGSLGTLGLITEVSLKVLPRPQVEYTLTQVCNQEEAIERLADYQRSPLPLSAACWYDDHLYIRLSGSEAATRRAQHQLGDNLVTENPGFWRILRDQQHPFFAQDKPLWRLSVPPATPPLQLAGDCLLDWGGSQRWLASDEEPARIRGQLEKVGGHASLFRHHGADEVFHPLPAALMALHKRLKLAMDPAGIFNPGRMYRDF